MHHREGENEKWKTEGFWGGGRDGMGACAEKTSTDGLPVLMYSELSTGPVVRTRRAVVMGWSSGWLPCKIHLLSVDCGEWGELIFPRQE